MMRKYPHFSKLRVESLEERTLLAVMAGGPETAIRTVAPTESVVWVVNTLEDSLDWIADDDVVSLREAIERANDGDRIVFDESLAGGTITLAGSELGIIERITIDATSIDGIKINADGKSSAFSVYELNSNGSVELIGLIITGGGIGNGGELTLTNCMISGNATGGIYNHGRMTMTNCTVSGNTSNYSGGGIHNTYMLTMTDCVISGNSADKDGGGIYSEGVLTLTHCTISDNTAGSGGGIYNYDNRALSLINCTISGNTAKNGDGGGIKIYGTRSQYSGYGTCVSLIDCAISGNIAKSSGGGISSESGAQAIGSLSLTNCSVLGNTASYGGGIHNIGYSSLSMTNCIVAGNIVNSTGGGGGILLFAPATMTNCTIVGNTVTYGLGGGIYFLGGKLTLYNTIVALNLNVYDNYDDIRSQNSEMLGGNNIIGFNPGFVVAPVFEYGELTNFDELDLSLSATSIAIDAGDNSTVVNDTDITGKNRIVASRSEQNIVDIGAYEYQYQSDNVSKTIIVTTDTDKIGESDNLTSLREAILIADDGDTITFDSGLSEHKILLSGASLEIDKWITIDASSIGGIVIDANGSFDLCQYSSRSIRVKMKGLTITNGCINNGEYSTLSLSECSITNNSSTAVRNNGKLSLTKCSISNNEGCGIINSGVAEILFCNISNNVVDNSHLGGGIYNGGLLSLMNSTVSENSAGEGGGIYNRGTLTLTNCTVSGNTAYDGGGIYNEHTLALTNSLVYGNTANGYGGGIYNVYDGMLTLTNSTVSANAAHSDGGIYNNNRTMTLTNTIVSFNYANQYSDLHRPSDSSFYDINNLIGVDPGFVVAPIFEDGILINEDDLDFSLTPESIAIDNGNIVVVKTETDLVGNPRIVAAWRETPTVDIGAYEYQGQIDPPAPIIVTTLLDVIDATDGLTSLREAIRQAHSHDVITFDTSLAGGTIVLRGMELTISTDLTIDATSIGGITVDAYAQSRVFYIEDNSSVWLIGLTVTGGWTEGDGGGICLANSGNLTLANSTVTGNTATNYGGGICNYSGMLAVTDSIISENSAFEGGGICNTGTLTIKNSTVSGNSAKVVGGGIYNENSTLTIMNSTVSGNAAQSGAGVFNNEGTLMLTNSLIFGNTASHDGGGVCSTGYKDAKFINCTISGNSAESDGGIRCYSGTTRYNATIVENCVIALNSARSSRDISQYYSGNSNLIGIDPGFNIAPIFDESGNLINLDLLDLSLSPESPAVDAGDNTYVTTDVDLAGNPRIVNNIVDIGAYEYQGSEPERLSAPTITTGTRGIYVSYGANRHRILWNAVDNASDYELAYSADGSSWMTAAAEETSAVITGLTYGAVMQYRVRALGDGGSYIDSDWSDVKTFNVCPMDIDGDGDISPGDRVLMTGAWLSGVGDDDFLYAADINGDGDIGGADRVYLSNNWLLDVEDDADDLVYPPAKASDAVFAGFASADLAADLNVF